MESTENILKSIIDDYKQIERSNDKLTEKCTKIRRSLCQIIKQQLVDVNKISGELKKARDQSSQTQTVLNFFYYLIDDLPHPVFVPSTEQCNNLSKIQSIEHSKEYSEFLFFLSSRLMKILTVAELTPIHEASHKIILLWLQLIKIKNISVYQLVLNKLVNLVLELHEIEENHFESEVDGNDIIIELKTFKSGAYHFKDVAALSITSFESLEQWQMCCNDLLKIHANDVSVFAFKNLNILWKILLHQIEFGQFPLKVTSMKLMMSLLRHNSITSSKVFHDFVLCIIAMIEYTGNGRIKNSFLIAGISEHELHVYDETLTEFLQFIFKIEHGNTFVTLSTLPKTRLVFDVTSLSMLADTLAGELRLGSQYDEVNVTACRYLILSAIQSHTEATLTSTFVNNCHKISSWLLQSVFAFPAKIDLGEALSFSFVFSSINDLESCAMSGSLISDENDKKQTERNISLSRKRPHDSSSLKSQHQKEKFSCVFLCEFSEKIDDLLNEQSKLIQQCKSNSIKTNEMMSVLTENVQCLTSVFQSFFQAFLMLKDDAKYVDYFVRIYKQIKLPTTFMKIFENYLFVANESKKRSLILNPDAVIEIYQHLVKLADLIVTWFHVLREDLSKPQTSESRSILEAASVLFSVLWLENMQWQDLKVGSTTFLTNASVLNLCHILRVSKFSEQDVLCKNDQIKDSVLKTCLSGLCHLPNNIALSWRSAIISKWGLSCNYSIIAAKCSSLVPCMCANMKKSVQCPFVRDVLSYVKEQQDGDHLVVENLSKAILPLADVLSGRCLKRTFLIADNADSIYTIVDKISRDLESVTDPLEGDNLTVFCEIEKFIYSYLKDTKVSNRGEEWNQLCRSLLQDIALVLKYANKRKMEAQLLQHQWLKYFEWDCEVGEIDFIQFDDEENSSWNETLIKNIESSFGRSMQSNQPIVQCNFVTLFGSIIRSCINHEIFEHGLFVMSLRNLCQLLASSVPRVSCWTYLELEKLSQSNENLFQNHRQTLCCNIVDTLLDDMYKSRSPLDVIVDLAQLFNLSLDNFLVANLHYLIPPAIVMKQSLIVKKQEGLLSLFSHTLGKPVTDLIMQNFKYIFCNAVINGTDLHTLFKYLEGQTRIKKDSLVLLNYGSLIQHLLAHASVDSNRVCEALQFIHEIKAGGNQSLSRSQLLKPHFLSVLTFFNGQLRMTGVTLVDKKQMFESLVSLLYLMDKSDVTAVSVKIINTLCLAQQVFAKSAWGGICCKAWDALVRCVEPSCLGGLISQVAVMLLPFVENYPSKVKGTLEYLVKERLEFTRNNFSDLYFLPDHEALKRVKLHIAKELKFDKKNQTDFINTLQQTTKQLLHESAEVRVYALARLRSILQSNQTALQRHCLLGGGSTDLIKQLASTLLTCCRDSNAKVRLLAAKCLGEIGAMDPDKLSLTMASDKPRESRSCVTFDDLEFAFDLFNCLVQAFMVAKPIHQDISAFAIQELLKIYQCKPDKKDSQGHLLWKRFSEQTQGVLEPHLSSRYMLKKSEMNLSTLKRPILHRKQNMTFREWIGTFCSVLMQMASSSVEESSKVRGVFEACAAVVRNDVNVALFLLPPTVVEVLKCQDDHVNFIVEEVMAVLESTEMLKDRKNDQKSSNYLTSLSSSGINNMENDSTKETPATSIAHTSHLSQLSAQAIFTVLDHVTSWQRQPVPTSGGSLARTRHAREKDVASNFISRVPQKTLAMASLRCRAHTRALLHYETYLRQSCGGKCDAESAAFLQRVFVEMNETDGVVGVVNVRGVEPTPETQLTLLESTGALQDAAACYERIIRLSPDDLLHHKGFVKCLIDLGQLSTVINVIDGTVTNKPSWENDLNSYRIEACWRLGQWDLLEKKLSSVATTTKDWSVGIGEVFLAIRGNEWGKMDGLLDDLYQSQTGPLSAASMESNSFQRGYEHILRLHMLSDLERVATSIRDQSQYTCVDDVMSLWQLRLRIVQSSFRAREPMMSLCRVMLPLLSHDSINADCSRHVGKLWLQSSKLARKCGHLQAAYGALLSAQPFALPGYCIEHAKWLWKKGESHQALLTLQRGSNENFSSNSSTNDHEQHRNRAKVMLLEAKLMEESSSFDSNTVLRKYKEVVGYMGEWEDAHFYCGRYYDKLMTTMIGESKATAKSHHLYYIMHHYGRSLCYGTSHIYETLTKLLTLWLDYGTTAVKLEKAGRPQTRDDVQRIVEVMTDVRSRLPAYIFYVAFSQLTSRICHEHEPTYSQLKEILVAVIQAFPQRALWSMMAISKSSFQQRATRCQEIFQRVAYKDARLKKLVSDATKLTNRLLELCNKPVTSIQPLSINTHFKSLKKLVEDANFSKIMLPLQKFMTATLPQTKQNMLDSQSSHNPFPEATSHIVGFNDAVDILSSLQRPKKISVRASDGTSCIFLCKPKDDLRKDARLTEFAAIVNKCLNRDPESGRRQLRIRTYAVLPLNAECGLIEWVQHMKPVRIILMQIYRRLDIICSNRELLACILPKTAPIQFSEAVVPLNAECGLIEWVNNTKGLRHILLEIYKARGAYITGKQLKAWQLPVSETLQKKLDVFRNKLLPRHPPVFHEWFLTTFTEPSAWYNARLAYARSLAVMSMVGYMLGLGDRHGENILFDSNSGEAMHVDFNCLFNKGMSLEVPEIVPFRLTHNLVDAMGSAKYEGFFRRACEVTMNVLREQREPLMSVLKTFIYDPLVEWSKKGHAGASGSGDVVTDKAFIHVNDIDKRLRGIVAKNKGLPLSIEGHVHYLIQEATDEENLCQMYIGWAPFM